MRITRLTAVGLLLAALAVPAVANSAMATTADVIPTAIVDLTASPSAISVGNTNVTVSGRLVESADPSVGVPNEPVYWSFMMATDGSIQVGWPPVTTGPDGTFTFSDATDVGGAFYADFNGDSTHGWVTASINVYADPEPTTITLDAQPRSVVPAGTELAFNGQAEAETAGVWQPLADEFIAIFRNGAYTGYGAFTDVDGTFAAAVPAADSGGAWQAVVWPSGGWPQEYVLYQQSRSNADQVNVEYQTRAALSVPAKREAHSTFTVSGDAQVWNGSNGWFAASGVLVNFYYRVQPGGNWVQAGSARTSASGSFSGTAKVVPGHLAWQVRVPWQRPGDIYDPSVSDNQNSFITDQTCDTLGVSHVRGRTIVSGIVRDSCGAKKASFGAVRGEVKVYYHPRGTSTWRYLGEVRTGGRGTFTYSRAGVLNGYFQVDFPAQGYYLASKSSEVYKN